MKNLQLLNVHKLETGNNVTTGDTTVWFKNLDEVVYFLNTPLFKLTFNPNPDTSISTLHYDKFDLNRKQARNTYSYVYHNNQLVLISVFTKQYSEVIEELEASTLIATGLLMKANKVSKDEASNSMSLFSETEKLLSSDAKPFLSYFLNYLNTNYEPIVEEKQEMESEDGLYEESENESEEEDESEND